MDFSKNHIILGDCLDWLQIIPSNSIDMCYIDPPFFSNRNYEVIWGNGYELRSFEDRWKNGIKFYAEWMRLRIKEIHRVLKDTGTIFVHCDWHANHHLRLVLDEIFGYNNFINELVWCYGSGGSSKRRFSRKHDTIYFYSKNQNYKFNCDDIREEYKEKCKVDYKIVNGKKYKRKNDLGRIPFDWFELPIITNTAKERIGYITQKPEVLLERIIKCSTDKNDIVLDCFGGGGTTASVASQLGRKFITGDVSPVAVRVMAKRLGDLKNPPLFEIHNTPRTKEEWLKMDDKIFSSKICDFMGWEGSGKDENINGWANHRKIPIKIKNNRNHIGVKQIRDFVESVDKYKQGIFVSWNFSKEVHDYLIDIKNDYNKEVEVIQVEKILDSILIDKE